MARADRSKRFDLTDATPVDQRPQIWVEGRQQPRFKVGPYVYVSLAIAKRDLLPDMIATENRLRDFGGRVQQGEVKANLAWAGRFARALPEAETVAGWILTAADIYAGARLRLEGKDPTASGEEDRIAYPDLIQRPARGGKVRPRRAKEVLSSAKPDDTATSLSPQGAAEAAPDAGQPALSEHIGTPALGDGQAPLFAEPDFPANVLRSAAGPDEAPLFSDPDFLAEALQDLAMPASTQDDLLGLTAPKADAAPAMPDAQPQDAPRPAPRASRIVLQDEILAFDMVFQPFTADPDDQGQAGSDGTTPSTASGDFEDEDEALFAPLTMAQPPSDDPFAAWPPSDPQAPTPTQAPFAVWDATQPDAAAVDLSADLSPAQSWFDDPFTAWDAAQSGAAGQDGDALPLTRTDPQPDPLPATAAQSLELPPTLAFDPDVVPLEGLEQGAFGTYFAPPEVSAPPVPQPLPFLPLSDLPVADLPQWDLPVWAQPAQVAAPEAKAEVADLAPAEVPSETGSQITDALPEPAQTTIEPEAIEAQPAALTPEQAIRGLFAELAEPQEPTPEDPAALVEAEPAQPAIDPDLSAIREALGDLIASAPADLPQPAAVPATEPVAQAVIPDDKPAGKPAALRALDPNLLDEEEALAREKTALARMLSGFEELHDPDAEAEADDAPWGRAGQIQPIQTRYAVTVRRPSAVVRLGQGVSRGTGRALSATGRGLARLAGGTGRGVMRVSRASGRGLVALLRGSAALALPVLRPVVAWTGRQAQVAASWALLIALMAFATPGGAIKAMIYYLDGGDLSDWQ